MKQEIEIAIIGGGPAGSTTAIALCQLGFRPSIFERNETIPYKPGEGLSPLVTPLLKQLHLLDTINQGDHLEAYGHQSWWGSEQAIDHHFLFNVHGNGWHLDRVKFEASLNEVAMERGTLWNSNHRLTQCLWKNNQWNLRFKINDQIQERKARFLVDATGRVCIPSRMIGAKRISADRLMSIHTVVDVLENSAPKKRMIVVEAVKGGWWYLALLPQNKISLCLLTDSDLIPFDTSKANQFFQQLDKTTGIKNYLKEVVFSKNIQLQIKPTGNSRLDSYTGPQWLAVGDAANAYDPLSGYGITAAMGGGYYAAQAIASCMNGEKAWANPYAELMASTYQACLKMFRQYYQQEQRWKGDEFWNRRH